MMDDTAVYNLRVGWHDTCKNQLICDRIVLISGAVITETQIFGIG